MLKLQCNKGASTVRANARLQRDSAASPRVVRAKVKISFLCDREIRETQQSSCSYHATMPPHPCVAVLCGFASVSVTFGVLYMISMILGRALRRKPQPGIDPHQGIPPATRIRRTDAEEAEIQEGRRLLIEAALRNPDVRAWISKGDDQRPRCRVRSSKPFPARSEASATPTSDACEQYSSYQLTRPPTVSNVQSSRAPLARPQASATPVSDARSAGRPTKRETSRPSRMRHRASLPADFFAWTPSLSPIDEL